MYLLPSVIPAKAGIQANSARHTWIPAFAGMTDFVRHLDSRVRGNDELRLCPSSVMDEHKNTSW